MNWFSRNLEQSPGTSFFQYCMTDAPVFTRKPPIRMNRLVTKLSYIIFLKPLPWWHFPFPSSPCSSSRWIPGGWLWRSEVSRYQYSDPGEALPILPLQAALQHSCKVSSASVFYALLRTEKEDCRNWVLPATIKTKNYAFNHSVFMHPRLPCCPLSCDLHGSR